MRLHRRANKVTNKAFPPTDPRRYEPGKQSMKRIGARWRERWHGTLKRSVILVDDSVSNKLA